MADWRQIQARIRKAKISTNPSAKLSELYQRTRDAMVAWELGVYEEKSGRAEAAANWYATAAQRFRRAEWKKKAEEALARLGVEPPASGAASAVPLSQEPAADLDAAAQSGEEQSPGVATESPSKPEEESREPEMPLSIGDIPETEISAEAAPEPQSDASLAAQPEERKKRRRGRRGGRGRRRKSAAGPSLPAQAFAEPAPVPATPATPSAVEETAAYPVSAAPEAQRAPARPQREPSRQPESPEPAEPHRASRTEAPAPQLPSERAAHGRAGDPALASRMAQLESMLRRLLASRLHRLNELDEAPAGPGVFLLSDSDQVTSYYVESCQTLRIGLGNLVRGGRAGRTHHSGGRTFAEIDLKGKFADHLGINPSKVSQYMKEHCVVRWIQLDDDAPHLAHFAIGVLRTPLNLD